MPCCWCNGDHSEEKCLAKMSIDCALEILGPIRAAEAQNPEGQYRYYLIGKGKVNAQTIKAAARRLKRGQNATK